MTLNFESTAIAVLQIEIAFESSNAFYLCTYAWRKLFYVEVCFQIFCSRTNYFKVNRNEAFFTTYNFKFSYKSSLVKLFAMEEKKLGKAG